MMNEHLSVVKMYIGLCCRRLKQPRSVRKYIFRLFICCLPVTFILQQKPDPEPAEENVPSREVKPRPQTEQKAVDQPHPIDNATVEEAVQKLIELNKDKLSESQLVDLIASFYFVTNQCFSRTFRKYFG